jgi:hypothetical protein
MMWLNHCIDSQRREDFDGLKKPKNLFEKLRNQLISVPILSLPDVAKQFILDTDASGTSIGAVLSERIDRVHDSICKPNLIQS